MKKCAKERNKILNQLLIYFRFKTEKITLTIKIQTVIYVILELAAIGLILKYIL